MPAIVLASTSPYRRELLARLQVAFDCVAPGIDETALIGEAPRDTARRLAAAKAAAVAAQRPEAIVIGSDQVADLDGQALGKPGSRDAAIEQLARMQGRTIDFHTALAVVCRVPQTAFLDCIETRVRFRPLDRAAIAAYVDAEPAFDVAGGAKIESLGIALIASVESGDPTALIGLPLIQLVTRLAQCGVVIPAPAAR